MEVKSFAQIESDIRNYIISHQDKLTDFNEGSVMASYIEAVSRELALLYVRCRVGFSTFMRSLPYSVFGFQQKQGLKASVKVVFSRSRPFVYDTTIPAGTIVSAGGLRFMTTEAGVVRAGEIDSNGITASAEDIGAKYNIGVGLIKKVVSTLSSDIVSVNNAGSASGGTDSEDWGAYIDRFSDYILGLSRTNGYGFQSALKSTNLVRSLQIEEHFPPLDGIWNMTVYVEDGSGGMTGDAIAEVKSIIDGEVAQSNGGYRAPGINIRYLTPDIAPIKIKVTVTAELDMVSEIDDPAIIYDVTEAIKKYINSLEIGQQFWDSNLTVVLKRISYLVDVDIEPLDVKININEIARFESCDVTVVVR